MRTLTIICLLGVGLLFVPQPTLGLKMSIVSVTAYSYSGGSYPHGVTASGKRVKEGMVALRTSATGSCCTVWEFSNFRIVWHLAGA